MATNDFKAFATAAGANVTTQETWKTLPALANGFSAGKASSAQVNKAIRQGTTLAAVIGQFIANAGLDATDDGDVATLVANFTEALLRQGAGGPAIGIPFFWPSAAMPNTVMDEWSDMVFLKWNGATFSAVAYPKLALVIPSLTLADARGEFPRIWDDGRGVDSGRTLLSAQGDAIREITGSVGLGANGLFTVANGAFSGLTSTTGRGAASDAATISYYYQARFAASSVVPTASENRPRNIAFNFLVRAK